MSPPESELRQSTPEKTLIAVAQLRAQLDMQGDDWNPDEPQAQQALLWAAAQGGRTCWELFDDLLEHGVSAACSNPEDANNTALHYVLISSTENSPPTEADIFKRVQTLLDHNANVNASNADGVTPLAIVVQLSQLGLAKLLLQQPGIAVDAYTQGMTCLHRAIEKDRRATEPNNSEIVRALLAAGASTRLKTARGETAIQLAQQMGDEVIAKLVRDHNNSPQKSNHEQQPVSPGNERLAPFVSYGSLAARTTPPPAHQRHQPIVKLQTADSPWPQATTQTPRGSLPNSGASTPCSLHLSRPLSRGT